MTSLSVRGLESQTLDALKALARRESASVNQVVVRLIEQALGQKPGKPVRQRHHDLDALAGVWSAEDAAAFEASSAGFGDVDSTLWT